MRFLTGLLLTLFIVFIVGSIFSLIGYTIAAHGHKETISGTVENLYNKRSGDSDTFYVVVKEKNGTVQVLANADSLIKGKHNSADVQATLEKGKAYTFQVYGYRVHFFSFYKNIYEDPELVEASTKGE
ncbi:hypothetical protein [Listeria newyorkensis]|uniref:hypothetical protein n=1 Tax=Listeria newyorkensis TaxID=1497681 RepID=UPI00051CE0D1|nr:hypothetical protein [Listeria newyorkensis]KGL43632.1 hypothetical protein EP58_07805 [Listeria newyorkensis]